MASLRYPKLLVCQCYGWNLDGLGFKQIPETIVEDSHCNTWATGWLNGTHPTVLDEIVTKTVCFDWNGFPCYWQNEIQIRKCGDYFLYYLPETPDCTARYCSE